VTGAIVRGVVIVVVMLATAAACTDRQKANFSAFGQAHTVRLYAADGHVIREWTSTGKVECLQGICDFMDAATKTLVRTTGDIVVTVTPVSGLGAESQ
jgi:hypothetical protein